MTQSALGVKRAGVGRGGDGEGGRDEAAGEKEAPCVSKKLHTPCSEAGEGSGGRENIRKRPKDFSGAAPRGGRRINAYV